MSPSAVSLLALALSTVVYGLASFLQGLAMARSPAAPAPAPGSGSGSGFTRVSRAMLSLPFLAGVGLDLVGVGLSTVALRELPLFLVQAAGVGSVGVTAALALLAGQQGDRVRLCRGLLAATVGCGLLAAAAEPAAATPLPAAALVALGAGIPAAGALALMASSRAPRGAGLALTAVAGLAFAGVGLCLRGGTAVGAGSAHLGLATAALLGITGTVLFAVALERCPVTLASGVLALTELLVPAAIGLLVLGDRVRGGFELAAAAGCALVVVALVELTLAESGDAAEDALPPPYAGEGLAARTVLPARA